MSRALLYTETMNLRPSSIKDILRSPLCIAVVIFSASVLFLYGPIFRGDVPLPTQSTHGLFWGAPDFPPVQSIFRDRIVQAYPYHLFVAEAIQSGHLPLWNNLIFTGTTFFANGQAGLLSLFKLPFWWLPPILSYIIVTLLQSVVGGVGMFVLGRKLGWKPAAGIIAGLTLTLSAPFVMRMTVTTMSAVIATLPWVLVAVLRLHEQLTWKRVIALAALIAIMIFCGHVQLAAFSFGFAIFWTLIWWRREQWSRRAVFFLLALGLGFGLTAVQMVPVKESLGLAYRQPAERSWGTVLNPARLFKPNIKQAASLATLLGQNILGAEPRYRGPGNYLEGNLYIGPFAFLFTAFSLVLWRKKLWRWLALLAFLIGGLYVFPGWWDLVGKIAPWITVTPVWRMSFMFIFVLSLLTGLGANDFFQRRWKKFMWLVVGVMMVTMLWQWWGILPFAPQATLFPQNTLLDRTYAETRNGDVLWTPNGALDQFMPYDIPIAVGYDSVYPAQYLELWSANGALKQRNQLVIENPSSQLLEVVGANLMLTYDPLPAGWEAIETSGYWTLAKKLDPYPAIHTVQNIIPDQHPAQISMIDPSITALVSDSLPMVDVTATANAKVTERTATQLSVSVKSTGNTVLVTNWQSYPGWKLSIDGREASAAILKVNHAFLGAAVEAGGHQLTFSYQPRSYVIGLWVSLVSLVLLVIVGWFIPRVKK